ncbi:MAG: MBL fold metallo-hydrolase [Deltaproteobacteria bacterium]|nr:MBL fold metallo-hydrolase [Kofleriaceae bacterium]
MLGPIGHIASLLAYATQRRSRATADSSTHADLAWSRSPRAGDLPPGLELQWLGVAGFRFTYQGQHLLVDPYVTRLPLGDLVRRRVVPADPERLRTLPDPVAILVGHTHFDHALDVPALAARAGCKAYGSESLAHLFRLHGRPELAVTAEPHRPIDLGPFTVTFVPSRHSRLAAGLWTPHDGELSCEHTDDLTPQAYRCGQVWGIHIAVAGATFYHHGSCNLVDDELRHRGVDYFLAGIAGRRFTPRYWQRILARLEPRVVVPHHFDDFFRPLDAPFAYSLNVNLAALPDELRAVSTDFEVRALALGESVRGGGP